MRFTWLARWQPQLLGLLRIVSALLFIAHGTVKLFSFPVTFDMPGPGPLPPMLLAAGLIELIAGSLILVGFLTRPAAFLASGAMAAAYWIAHASQSFWPVANSGDAAILYCFVFLYIAAAGPGAWSIDRDRESLEAR